MQRNRSRHEIIFSILKIVTDNNNSIRPTPLFRFSNLSSKSFSEYYNELLLKGFVREIEDRKGKKIIQLTDKGFKYLEKYRIFLDIIDEFEL